MKYPLLIKQVLKYTEEPDDLSILGTCLVQLEEAVSAVDKAMAEAKCRASIALMEFLDEDVPEAVAAAQEEILEGSLRNSRGTVRDFLQSWDWKGQSATRGALGIGAAKHGLGDHWCG